MKKSISVNTIFNVAYKLLNMVFPLVTSAYLSRILGPSNIGRVDYAWNIMSYFLVVASLGIPTYGMREIANSRRDRDRKNRSFSELFILNGFFSLICSTIYIVCIIFINRFNSDIKLYLCTGLTLFMNVINVDWVYSGDEEYVYISIRSLIVKVASLAGILLYVRSQNDYIVYALITSVATTGGYLFNIINLKKHVRLTFSNLSFGRHFKPIIILFTTLLATDLYNQIDVTMLGFYYDDRVIGFYSNGIKLIRVITSITVTIASTILPRMCFYYKEKKSVEYNQLFWKTLWVVLICAIPSSVGIFLISEDAVNVLFGIHFIPTIQIIRILSPIIIIISISYLVGSVILTSTSNEKYLLRATFSGAVTNIVLNALLIPRFSTTGAAIASIAGELVVFAIHFGFGKRHIEERIKIAELLKILASTSIMIGCVLGIKLVVDNVLLRLVLSIVVSFMGYSISLLILKSEPAYDIFKRIKRLGSKMME